MRATNSAPDLDRIGLALRAMTQAQRAEVARLAHAVVCEARGHAGCIPPALGWYLRRLADTFARAGVPLPSEQDFTKPDAEREFLAAMDESRGGGR